jgi:hypothetical protein
MRQAPDPARRLPIDGSLGSAYKRCLSSAIPKSGFQAGNYQAESDLTEGSQPANP